MLLLENINHELRTPLQVRSHGDDHPQHNVHGLYVVRVRSPVRLSIALLVNIAIVCTLGGDGMILDLTDADEAVGSKDCP